MALEKKVTYRCEHKKMGIVEILQISTIYENNEQVGKPGLHRWVNVPGMDISNQPIEVQSYCNGVWVPAIVAEWEEFKEAQNNKD